MRAATAQANAEPPIARRILANVACMTIRQGQTLTNQIALITGVSRGLGRTMALHLAKRGAHIIGTYRSGSAKAEALGQEIEALVSKATMLALDVKDTTSFPIPANA